MSPTIYVPATEVRFKSSIWFSGVTNAGTLNGNARFLAAMQKTIARAITSLEITPDQVENVEAYVPDGRRRLLASSTAVRYEVVIDISDAEGSEVKAITASMTESIETDLTTSLEDGSFATLYDEASAEEGQQSLVVDVEASVNDAEARGGKWSWVSPLAVNSIKSVN